MKKVLVLLSGPLATLIMLSVPSPEGVNSMAWRFLAITVWILIWWMTEIVPIAVTSLLPLVLFPISGVMAEKLVASHYAQPVIFLFMGGFFLAESLKKWNLHTRFAYSILYFFGKNIPGLIGGFMVATAFLSMWVSNTATSIMMAAIGISVIETISKENTCKKKQLDTFAKALLLAIAYSASIGGITTLIGTPPNLLFAGFMKQNLDTTVSMIEWMGRAFPFVTIMGIITWAAIILYHSQIRTIPIDKIRNRLQKEKSDSQKLQLSEWTVITIFFITAILWILRVPFSKLFNLTLSDSMIAIAASLLLFCVPSTIKNKSFLLDWETARGIPWGILLLFGAGLSLATGFTETGLDIVVADLFDSLNYIPKWMVLFLLVTFSIFLTELISNTATTATLLPILLVISTSLNIPFTYLAIPVTIACSAAFMLPIATPPNAVAFSFNFLKVSEMARFGLILNFLTIVIITFLGLIGWF